MAKFTIVVLALSVLAVQGAVLRSNDDTLNRKVRSACYPCDHKHGPPLPPLLPGPPPPPPGPPPPPFFHTKQWSGYARTRDGSQQGVFSGAEAAATDGNQASGQAYSLTSANNGGGSSYGLQHSSNGYNGQSVESSHGQYEEHKRGDKHGAYEGQQHVPSISYGSAAQAQAQAQSGSGRGDLGQVENFGKYSSNSRAQSNANGGGFQQQQEKFGSHSDSFNEQQQVQSFGHGGYTSGANAGASATGGASGQYQGQESAQSALNGALNLAQQGLQVQQPTGCSTCGKSSYALSNAKSHSGSAVALSIGG